MTYSAKVGGRDVPITTCRADLADIASVHTVNRGDQPFLFVALKAQRAATYGSGRQPVALVPIGTDAAATSAVNSILRACCSASPPPVRRVAVATPSPQPFVAPAVWIENEGLFDFVRIHNRGRVPLTVDAGEIVNCRDVAYGCGRLAGPPMTLAPGGVATVATVMSANPRNGSTFSYRYEVRGGAARYTATGDSARRSSDVQPAMSAEDIRSAEAVAVAAIGARLPPPGTAAPAHVAPHLLQRGSSRLGVGQCGTALVRVRIGSDGMPSNASIVSITNRALVAAALETAVSSTYAPAMRNGRRQDEDYVATFQFDGNDPSRPSIPIWRRSPFPSATPSSRPSPSPTQRKTDPES